MRMSCPMKMRMKKIYQFRRSLASATHQTCGIFHTWQLYPFQAQKTHATALPPRPILDHPSSIPCLSYCRIDHHHQSPSRFVTTRDTCTFVIEEIAVAKMSGAQGANPPGSFTDTTYSNAPGADTQATQSKVDSTQDEKGLPVQHAADNAPKPNESAGLGGPVFGANEGADKGALGSSFTQ